MKMIKAFLVGIAGLFIMITLLSLLITSTPAVSRTVVINNTSLDKVYHEIADLNNWKHWHPAFISPEATVTYSANTKGAGAACDILYNNKTTHLSISKTDSAATSFLLTATGENNISNQLLLTPVTGAAQIKVDWIATTHLHWYPWEKFYAIFMDKLTGPGYEAALNGLKLFVETKQQQ